MPEYGKHLLKDFLLEENTTFVGHGAYGAVAKRVHEAKLKKQLEFESHPDRWFRLRYWGYYKQNIEAVAAFLGAEPDNMVFVRNTSTGINTVLKSFPFCAGDKILIHSWTYATMKFAVQWLSEKTGVEFVMYDLRIPLTKNGVMESLKRALDEHGDSVKFAIIDYISSVPAIRLPWEDMAALCKERSVAVLMDGAHTPGQVNLNLKSIAMAGVDFYVGNLHKWCYTPRGCAVLYVKSEHLSYIDPLTISINLHHEDIRRRFYYQGTDDGTTYCVAEDAMSFISEMGGVDSITTYTSGLVSEAAEMLAKAWGTRTLDIPPDMEPPNLRTIRLPDLKKFPPTKEVKGDVSTLFGDIIQLTLTLMERFRIVTLCIFIQSEPFVRISANIYNTMEDFEKLRDAILTLKAEEDTDS